ncbi:MAG TPA: hypothetical protein VN034_00030 [Sphingopyxis sp.]|nr:hypothetical protein [Sphingopyxis sp.]
MILVAKDLADLGQGCAGTEKLGRETVAENMRTAMGDAADPGSLERSAGNIPDAAGRREPRMRRVGLQEELAVIRCRTTALKISSNGRSDVGRQRHDRRLPSLALNAELADAPVDVVEREGRDFLCPQSKPGEQQQDRVVAAP